MLIPFKGCVIAVSSAEEIRRRTEGLIEREGSCLAVPLMKEIRTHIAVTRAFTAAGEKNG